MTLQEYFYTKKHEWVNVEGDKGTVGVSAYAVDALGEIAYVELPDPGASVTAGEECGTLESVKAVGDLVSPVTGTVTEKNDDAINGPALINHSPMKDGWLFKCDLSNPEETKELLTAEQYEEFLKECEEH